MPENPLQNNIPVFVNNECEYDSDYGPDYCDPKDSVAGVINKNAADSNIDYMQNIIEDFKSTKQEAYPFSFFNFAANILNEITEVSVKSLKEYRALRYLSILGDITVLSAFIIVPLTTHSYAFANALQWFSFMDPLSNMALQSLNVLCGMFIYAKVFVLLVKESYKMSENIIDFWNTFEFMHIKNWDEFKFHGLKLLKQFIKILLATALTVVLFKLTALSFGALNPALKFIYLGASAIMGTPNSLATIRSAGTLFCFLISYQLWNDIIKSSSKKISYMHEKLKNDKFNALLSVLFFLPKQIYREVKGLVRLVYTFVKSAVILTCLKFTIPWGEFFKPCENFCNKLSSIYKQKEGTNNKKGKSRNIDFSIDSAKCLSVVSSFFNNKAKQTHLLVSNFESKLESNLSSKFKFA